MKTKKIALSLFTLLLSILPSQILPWSIARETVDDIEDTEEIKTQDVLQQEEVVLPSYSIPKSAITTFAPSRWSHVLQSHLDEVDDGMDSIKEAQLSRVDLMYEALDVFITRYYNNSRYADYLSQNPQDLILLLKKVRDLDLGTESISLSYTLIRLFHEKFKQCELVDDTTFSQILSELPDLLGYIFEMEEDTSWKQSISKTFKNSLFSTFSSHLPLADEFEGKAQLIKVDVAKHPGLLSRYGSRSIPTLIFVNEQGQEQIRAQGFMAKEQLIEKIQKLL